MPQFFFFFKLNSFCFAAQNRGLPIDWLARLRADIRRYAVKPGVAAGMRIFKLQEDASLRTNFTAVIGGGTNW
jgi:hypothetical protein